MRIHTRLALCFAAVVLLTVGLLSYYINAVLMDRVESEKAEDYRNLQRQLANGVVLTTRQIEQNLFNQYTGRDVAGAMLAEQEPVAKALNLQFPLAAVPLNVTPVESVLAIDREGNRFFAGRLPDDSADDMAAILSDELYDTFTLWLSDGAGHVFLKKDVYQVFPLKYAGIMIVQMDTARFMAALGLDMQVDGMLAVMTEQGRPLVLTGGLSRALLDEALAAEPLSYKPVSRKLALTDGEYWLTVQPAVNQSWYTLQLVPMKTMLRMPLSMTRILWLGSLAIIAAAFLLGMVITHSIARNVKRLLRSMEEMSRGNFETSIPIESSDEIGELADRFRWMQQELKTVTGKMVLRATEKQQAEYEMLDLRYRSLLAQISPHFLCNVLSSINALAVMGKNEEVSTLSVRAADYLRDNLAETDQKFTTLGQEIHYVEEYVELSRDVYSSTCDFQVDVCDEAVECRVPNMLLQPLVENALVHGRLPDGAQQIHHIRISALREIDTLVLTVSNDGQGISPQILKMIEMAGADQELSKQMKGFGLRGVMQRLRLLYGDRQSLRVVSGRGLTTITIRLPFEQYELNIGD